MRLTKTTVAGIKPGGKTTIHFDSEVVGFGVRVTPAGAKAWIFEYRAGGGRRAAKRRLTIGSVAALTADQARRAAQELQARVRLGADPASERNQRRTAATVAELVDRYMRDEISPIRKVRTTELYGAYFRLHVLPKLGTRR